MRLSELNLTDRNCSYVTLDYVDPHYPNITRHATVFRGPTSFVDREAIFLHFELDDPDRDFYTVSYFVFPGFDDFRSKSFLQQASQMIGYHRYVPTFALSSGLRMWIKLIMSETHWPDNSKDVEFKVEVSFSIILKEMRKHVDTLDVVVVVVQRRKASRPARQIAATQKTFLHLLRVEERSNGTSAYHLHDDGMERSRWTVWRLSHAPPWIPTRADDLQTRPEGQEATDDAQEEAGRVSRKWSSNLTHHFGVPIATQSNYANDRSRRF